MGNFLFPTPFKLTPEELLLSSAATIIFNALVADGRKNISISDICEPSQYGYTASAERIANGPRFVRITDIKGGKINWETVPYCTCDEPDKYAITKNDILVARAGSIGKSFLVGEVPELAVFASYMIRLRARDGTLPSYIYWFFQSQQFWFQIASFDRGSAMSNVNGKMLSSIVLPIASAQEQELISTFLQALRKKLFGEEVGLPDLPAPMQDVRRIVERVEALAARIAKARSLREKTNEELVQLFISAISNLPIDEKNWTTVGSLLLSQKGSIHSGPFGSDLTHDQFVESGVAAIGTRDVQVNRFSMTRGWFVTPERFESLKQYQIHPNDVLVTIIGGSIGRFCVVPEDVPLAFTTKHIIAMKFDPALVLPTFASYLLNYHRRCRETMFSQTAGSAQPSLNASKVKAIHFPKLSLDEQRRIVAYLDSVQARLASLRELQSATGEELSALLPSVLDRAFKGEL